MICNWPLWPSLVFKIVPWIIPLCTQLRSFQKEQLFLKNMFMILSSRSQWGRLVRSPCCAAWRRGASSTSWGRADSSPSQTTSSSSPCSPHHAGLNILDVCGGLVKVSVPASRSPVPGSNLSPRPPLCVCVFGGWRVCLEQSIKERYPITVLWIQNDLFRIQLWIFRVRDPGKCSGSMRIRIQPKLIKYISK